MPIKKAFFFVRWADDRMAKSFSANRGMKRKVKFAFSLTAAVIQYCMEKREGKAVISKKEFVKQYYKKYLETNNSTQKSHEGIE